MRIGNLEVKRRVWIGLGFGLAVTGGWWAWTQSQRTQIAAPKPAKQPFVQLTGAGPGTGDQVLRERSELFDPTPLFFPTEWNSGQRPLPDAMRRQPGEVFGSYPPNLEFGSQGIKAYGTEAVLAPERLADVLAQGNEAPFAGIGQIDVRRPPLPTRAGFLEIRTIIGGKLVMAQALENIIVPRVDFAPVEYLVAVTSAGVVGDPILMVGAEGEEIDESVDAFFRTYLVKTFRLGERLDPGRYRVLVGP
ncbi:MAG TPA: hypothetical protein VL860_05725 [Planctomycetota bacterium]|nr:hypothetical protein [Planctomycetota bacterium]